MRPLVHRLRLACLATAFGLVAASGCSSGSSKGEVATGAKVGASADAPAAADTPDLPKDLATLDVGTAPRLEPAPELCGSEACAEGFVCADVLEIDCDPKVDGGANCEVLCIPKKCQIPARTYRSRNPSTCADMAFSCDLGLQYFGDDCGCGCFKY